MLTQNIHQRPLYQHVPVNPNHPGMAAIAEDLDESRAGHELHPQPKGGALAGRFGQGHFLFNGEFLSM